MDILLASIGLVVLSPVLVALAVVVRLTSPGPSLFAQERIGRGFRPFRILKFRSMVADAPQRGGPITIGADPRITRAGRFLRKTKIDELPQLFNVLKGDMSFVGPRPEARCYVEMFRQDYETILQVRPGVTDLASLKYRNEAEILAQAGDPEREYVARVLPEKIRLAKEYVAQSSVWLDLWIIAKTVLILLHLNAPTRRQAADV
jgi:lipopolysaccharide/colanic/teichoic acid biosynthesis glycosyltransferase